MKSKRFLYFALSLIGLCVLLWVGVTALRVGNYKGKLWAHRVNSLEKRAEFREDFPNFEVDVNIRILDDSLILDVTHDADTTFGLTFDEFIPDLGEEEKVWVDVKNLSKENNQNFLEKFLTFCSKYGVRKNQFIIETRDYEALELLTENGFYTSYYLDFKKLDRAVVSHIDSISLSGGGESSFFPL